MAQALPQTRYNFLPDDNSLPEIGGVRRYLMVVARAGDLLLCFCMADNGFCWEYRYYRKEGGKTLLDRIPETEEQLRLLKDYDFR